MANVFLCPACKGTIAAEEAIGEEVRCPACEAVVVVSADDSPPPIHVEPISSDTAFGAFVCSIIGLITCIPIFGLIAVILGVKAKNRATHQPQRYGGRGLAIAAICLGLLGIITSASLVPTVIVPAFIRARVLARREYCVANLRGIMQSFYIYTAEPPGYFPSLTPARDENDGAFLAFDPQVRINGPVSVGMPSPTADLWFLIMADYTTQETFICPNTTDVPDPTQNVSAYHDFSSPQNLSYAYQYQHDPDRHPISTSSEPWFPVLADANPYIKGGVTADFAADRASESHGNSFNHHREGQNVAYQDGHINFEQTPDVGMKFGPPPPDGNPSTGGDNIYTIHKPGGSFDPGDAAPTLVGTRGTCNLGSKSDACLIP